MALATHRVSAHAAPGMAAAATARPVSGGRNVASVRETIEESGFSAQIGVNDNASFRYEDELEFDTRGEKRHQQEGYTPLLFRTQLGFQVEAAEERADSGGGSVFLAELMHGVGAYEQTMRATTPGMVKAGSVLNYLY